MKNKLFCELRRSMRKKDYRAYCSSLRGSNGFNTGTITHSDKREGRGGANARKYDGLVRDADGSFSHIHPSIKYIDIIFKNNIYIDIIFKNNVNYP